IRWDIRTGKPVGGPWKLPFQLPADRIEWSPDGGTMLLHSEGGAGLPWDLAGGRSLGKPLPASGQDSVWLSDDGRFVALSGQFTVDLLRLPRWDQEAHKLRCPSVVMALAFAPGSGKLFTGTLDGRCAFWDPGSARQTGELAFPRGYARSVAFAP